MPGSYLDGKISIPVYIASTLGSSWRPELLWHWACIQWPVHHISKDQWLWLPVGWGVCIVVVVWFFPLNLYLVVASECYQSCCKMILQMEIKKMWLWEFPGGPVIRTPCSYCGGPRFKSWLVRSHKLYGVALPPNPRKKSVTLWRKMCHVFCSVALHWFLLFSCLLVYLNCDILFVSGGTHLNLNLWNWKLSWKKLGKRIRRSESVSTFSQVTSFHCASVSLSVK